MMQRKSLVLLWAALLLAWPSVSLSGQESQDSPIADWLDTCIIDLEKTIEQSKSLETEISSLLLTINSLSLKLEKVQAESENSKQVIEGLEKTLQKAEDLAGKQGKLLKEQGERLETLRQNYRGLLTLSRKLQTSSETWKNWTVGLGVSTGVLGLALVIDLAVRR